VDSLEEYLEDLNAPKKGKIVHKKKKNPQFNLHSRSKSTASLYSRSKSATTFYNNRAIAISTRKTVI
jgi:hypothetical protein